MQHKAKVQSGQAQTSSRLFVYGIMFHNHACGNVYCGCITNFLSGEPVVS